MMIGCIYEGVLGRVKAIVIEQAGCMVRWKLLTTITMAQTSNEVIHETD